MDYRNYSREIIHFKRFAIKNYGIFTVRILIASLILPENLVFFIPGTKSRTKKSVWDLVPGIN